MASRAGELLAAGLDQKSIFAVAAAREHTQPDADLARLADIGIQVLTWDETGYPKLLKQINDPPPVLYVKGELKDEDAWAIGIVGTRRATVYGREVSESLSGELARNHITVVSGMARGIDGYAHQAALKAGGRTVAVLGCGVDVIYPPEHRLLVQQIIEHGALVSDYPPGTQPDALNFPPRNRIISGMSWVWSLSKPMNAVVRLSPVNSLWTRGVRYSPCQVISSTVPVKAQTS